VGLSEAKRSKTAAQAPAAFLSKTKAGGAAVKNPQSEIKSAIEKLVLSLPKDWKSKIINYK